MTLHSVEPKKFKFSGESLSMIDFLPDEILVEIFNNLDETSLVIASKCCMR